MASLMSWGVGRRGPVEAEGEDPEGRRVACKKSGGYRVGGK